MNSKTFHRARFAGALVALLAVAACGGTAASGTASQPVTAAANAPQTAADSTAAAPRRHDPAQMVAHFDANHDGALQLSELPPRMQQHMSAADTNHDGTLSADELTAFRDARAQERFARHDTNGDGAITADEAGPQRWAFLSRADADHDGRVTRAELDQARASGAMRFAGGFHRHGRDRGENDAPAATAPGAAAGSTTPQP